MSVDHFWNVDWQGKPKYSGKTRPSATSSITYNLAWDSNPGRGFGSPSLTAYAVERPMMPCSLVDIY
jgi:hypothetical protein